MKATGIVRRIDDLGRVVIPKEIRRTMRIREGDPLEIYTDNDGEVIFKKYSPIGELSGFAGVYAEVLHKTGGAPVVVCDRDHVVAVSGIPKKELLFICLSGFATGGAWLCYYKALQDGLASVVVPIDKLSILVTIAFSYIVFKEKLSKKSAAGLVLITAGTLMMALPVLFQP